MISAHVKLHSVQQTKRWNLQLNHDSFPTGGGYILILTIKKPDERNTVEQSIYKNYRLYRRKRNKKKIVLSQKRLTEKRFLHSGDGFSGKSSDRFTESHDAGMSMIPRALRLLLDIRNDVSDTKSLVRLSVVFNPIRKW